MMTFFLLPRVRSELSAERASDCQQTVNCKQKRCVFAGFLLAIEYRLFAKIPFSRFLMVFKRCSDSE